jgi:hypothetical protein
LRTGKENFVSNQEPQVPFSSEPSVNEYSFSFKLKVDQAKKSNHKTPRSSSTRSPDEMSTIGTARTYWKHTIPSFVGKDKTYGSMVVQDKRTNQLGKVKLSTIGTARTYWKHTIPSFVGKDKTYGSMVVQDKRMN